MDSDTGGEQQPTAPGARKKQTSRESSKRFREKKKALEKSLTEENAALRDALEETRKAMAASSLDPSPHYVEMHHAMRMAAEHLQKSLPSAIMKSVQDTFQARHNTGAVVSQTVRNLQKIIPPVAFSEIGTYVVVASLELGRGSPTPAAPLLKDLYGRIDSHSRIGGPSEPHGIKKMFLGWQEERLRELLENKRRLRLLLEEAVALMPRIDEGDAWYHNEVEPRALSNMAPPQIAASFQWYQENIGLLQDLVIGHRFEGLQPSQNPFYTGAAAASPSPSSPSFFAGASSSAYSPAIASPSVPAAFLEVSSPSPPSAAAAAAAAAAAGPLNPAPAHAASLPPASSSAPSAALATPTPPTSTAQAAAPPAPPPAPAAPPAAAAPARKRGAEGRAAGRLAPAAPGELTGSPAPAGTAIPPDVLKELIREAVTKELAALLQAPATPPAGAGPGWAAGAEGAAPALDLLPELPAFGLDLALPDPPPFP